MQALVDALFAVKHEASIPQEMSETAVYDIAKTRRQALPYHLFLHPIPMVANSQIEANGTGELEVDLVDEAVAFPELA